MAKLHWCDIKCVNEDWFWNSISEKVCLEESSYALQGAISSYVPKVIPVAFGQPQSQDKFIRDLLPPAPTPAAAVLCSVSELFSSSEFNRQGQQDEEPTTSGERDPMYLSGCRFFLAGFESVEMRRLVHMVMNGGGTRYMELNERVTHVVFGKPSESELKDIRQYFTWGAMHLVMPIWLEECTRQRREVVADTQFMVPLARLTNDSHWRSGRDKQVLVDEKKSEAARLGAPVLPRKMWDGYEAKPDAGADFATSGNEDASRQPLNTLLSNTRRHLMQGVHDSKSDSSQILNIPDPAFLWGPGQLPEKPLKKTTTSGAGCEHTRCEPYATPTSLHVDSDDKERVFQGHVFVFATSFEVCMRAQVVQWVLEGGGILLEEGGSNEAEFMICPHGFEKVTSPKPNVKNITAQWIKYCLQEGTLLDVNSHILFQPLGCGVPLPGFQTLRFAVTQYADRERILLYNLCHVLGAKYQEKKMNRRATHLLCKVGDGDKYEAALQWGVEIVTAEWLYACVAQDMVVAPDLYRPKKLTAAEKEAGMAIPTQHFVELTSDDTGFPVMERCLAESNAEILLSAKGNEIGRVETNGKTLNIKKKSSLRGRLQALQGKKPLTDCSLTSQSGGNLDPWDELTAFWTSNDAKTRPATRSQQKAVSFLGAPVDLGRAKTHGECHDGLKESDRPTDGSQGTEHQGQIEILLELDNSADPSGCENDEDESGKDVAAAIEGLLAQTSKVQSEDASRTPEGDRDLLSHDMIKLGRRNAGELRERANFKRSKHLPNSAGEEPAQSAPQAEDNYDTLEESQMDSQVVAYDEDHTEKQKIIERVRTRSMSTPSGSGGNVERKEMSWKAVELKRLLKAADANK